VQILIKLDERVAARLIARALELTTSLEVHIENVLRAGAETDGIGGATANPASDYLAEAVTRARAMRPDDRFTLNADHRGTARLFTRDEWRRMLNDPSFSPTTFGKEFKDALTNPRDAIAELLEKTSDNRQIYRRV
jgi:hypothetical protein